MPTFNGPETGPAVAHFETPRLHARPFHPADAEAFAAYRAQPQVERYQSWSNYTLEQGRTLINSMQNIQPGIPGEWYQ
ncbi:GNAT family N-acetyltransferase, partial [Microbacterium sp. Bi128]